MCKVDIDTLTMKQYLSLTKGNQAPRNKKEKYKSLAHKARKVLSEEEATSSDSNDEEYSMVDDKKEIADRRCFKCGDPNHFISDCPKHFFNDQKTFVVGCWGDSEDDSKKEEICLMALDDNKTPYELFKGKKPSLEYFKVFGSKCFILNTKDYLTKFDPKSTEGIFLGYSPNSKAYVILNRETMRVEESLNVKFDENPPLDTPPLEYDDVLENENIKDKKKT
nr:retrovirus-related Pol polyprotein from transposon TNT 1-94 [Tanacetum cinerariifolium]